MEVIIASPNIKPLSLKRAQHRLFLGVATLANILASNGMKIAGWALQSGTPSTQERPPSSALNRRA